MKYSIEWLGHAAVKMITKKGTVIYIDPFLNHDYCPIKAQDINRADIVLITHDHGDHVGQAATILKNTDAVLVAQPELISTIRSTVDIPDAQVVNDGGGMNIGGTVKVKDVLITMVEATHSSNSGEPSGFILEIDGSRVYHAGDTGIFATMEILGRLYAPAVSFLPIGGVFTMDAVQAAEAARMLKTKVVIPMHYMTFPVLEQSAQRFKEVAREIAPEVKVKVLTPGEQVSF